jgi:hypothetical protein
MSRDINLRVNTGVEQKGFTVTSSEFTKISNWNGVDREFFSVNIKGEDSAVKVLFTTDPLADEKSMKELNQGLIALSEFLFLRCDFYVKVANGGADTDIAVWESKKN